jgi:transcriptional regulator with XRE-family HTH domain
VGLLIHKLEVGGVPGANYPSISGYMKNEVDPPLAFIKAASETLNVREAWLAFGEGAPTKEEEAARRVRQEKEDTSSPYARILAAIPDLERFEDFDPSVTLAFVEYVIRLMETLGDLGADVDDEPWEELAVAAWESMIAPIRRWKKHTKMPIEPRGFADYSKAMLNALSLSLRLAVPEGISSEDAEMWDSLSEKGE